MTRLESRLTLLWIVGVALFSLGQVTLNRATIASLPAVVLAALDEKYPNAYRSKVETRKGWGGTVYEITLREGGESLDMSVKPCGEVVKVERMINTTSLPPSVKSAIYAAHPRSAIYTAEEVSRGGRLIGYEVAVKPFCLPVRDITFSPTGEVISKKWK